MRCVAVVRLAARRWRAKLVTLPAISPRGTIVTSKGAETIALRLVLAESERCGQASSDFYAQSERKLRACSSVDRADGFGPSGRGFESCRARQFSRMTRRSR